MRRVIPGQRATTVVIPEGEGEAELIAKIKGCAEAAEADIAAPAATIIQVASRRRGKI